ncbi:MAG TPA: AI-2E family transporter [Ramlibacter sp.]
MTPQPPSSQQDKALLGLVLVATLMFALVLWPLVGALSWAVFLAVVFAPLQERVATRLGGRRGWAALATLALIVVSVLLPVALLSGGVAHDAAAFYSRLKSGDFSFAEAFQQVVAVLPEWARSGLSRLGIEDLAALQGKLAEALGRSSSAVTQRVFVIGQGTLAFVVNFFVMLYLLFFFLRDGRSLAAGVEKALPLSPQHTRRVAKEFVTVVRATVKGHVVVALIQGTLGWLAFWFLDINSPLLWGAAMAVLSFVPAVGAALVWAPVAVYLVATGSLWAGIGLALWGVLVIGLVDNVLRPILVGKGTRMPDWLVLVATLGGLAVFGLQGFVLGPVVAAIFIAAWEIFADSRG